MGARSVGACIMGAKVWAMSRFGYLQVREAYRRKLESAQRDVAELSRAVAIMQDDPKTGLRVTPGEQTYP